MTFCDEVAFACKLVSGVAELLGWSVVPEAILERLDNTSVNILFVYSGTKCII